MKSCSHIFLCAVFLFAASCSSPLPERTSLSPKAPEETATDFTLGTGDEIAISVWRHEDLNRRIIIRPSGQIFFPLAGEIAASGMSVAELQDTLVSRLSEYFVNPQIDITLVQVRSQKVHVLGEVKTPGSIYLNEDLTVIEAVAMAGGFTRDANESRVLLVRDGDSEVDVTVLDIGLESMAQGEGLTRDYSLRSRDIVYVPPLRIVSVERFMQRFNNIINPIVNVERGIVLAPDVLDALKGESEKKREIIVAP